MTTLPEALSALTRPVDTACTLIEHLLGEPFKVAGDVLADQVRYWQWNNRLRIIEKAQEKLQERGLLPRALRPDFFLPFVEESGGAEDADLRNLWAELLVSAVENPETEHVAFVHVLQNMNGNDARVLDAMIRLGHQRKTGRNQKIVEETGMDTKVVYLSVENLQRLGFFSPYGNKMGGFGASFIRACGVAKDALPHYLEQQEKDNGKIYRE